MASPIPIPSVFVVKNRPNIRSIIFGSIPGPEFLHRNQYVSSAIKFRLEMQDPRTIGYETHRLNGVFDQVHHDLL